VNKLLKKIKNYYKMIFGMLRFQFSTFCFHFRTVNCQLSTPHYCLLPIVLFVTLCSSCNQKTFKEETALLDYIKDEVNGYVQHKTINGVDYTLMYRPTDMLVKQELGDTESGSQSLSTSLKTGLDESESLSGDELRSLSVAEVNRVEELRKKYKKHLYFNLSMSKNNQELLNSKVKNRNEFGAMVNQLAFGMEDKVHVYTPAKDTIEMADFIYPRMYGMSGATTIMFVYPRKEKMLQEDYLNFTIEDLGMYTGEVKFKIDIEKIKNEPSLKL